MDKIKALFEEIIKFLTPYAMDLMQKRNKVMLEEVDNLLTDLLVIVKEQLNKEEQK